MVLLVGRALNLLLFETYIWISRRFLAYLGYILECRVFLFLFLDSSPNGQLNL